MDQLTAFLTRRNIIALIILAVMAVGLVVGVRLVQQQTQLKSKAAAGSLEPAPVGPYPCDRPTDGSQLNVGDIAGRCNNPPDSRGCYQTAYATYKYTTDQDGDDVADPKNPNDQPWCDSSNCSSFYDQCPASPISSPTSLSGSITLASSTITYGGTISGTVTANNVPWRVSFCNDASRANCSATSNNWTQLGTGSGNGDFSYSPVNTTGTYTIALLNQNTNAIASQTTITINPAGGGGGGVDVGVGGVDVGTCSSITIDGRDYKTDFKGMVINQTYEVQITMTNTKVSTPQNDWKSGYYLQYKGTSEKELGLSTPTIPVPNPPVSVGDSRPFPVFIVKPTKEGTFQFYWQMYNDQNQPFLQGQSGICSPKFTVFTTLPGDTPTTGACPVGQPAGFIGGADRNWDCRPSDNIFGCVTSGLPPVGGVPGEQLTCSTQGQSCVACLPPGAGGRNTFPFGQCGVCRNNPKTQTQDPKCEDPVATRDDDNSRCTGSKTIGPKKIKDICMDTICERANPYRDCGYSFAGGSVQLDPELCTDQDKPFCQTTGAQKGFCLATPAGPTSTPTPAAKTACFFMDVKPITATSCADPGAQTYTVHPMVIPHTLTTPGRTTIFARFISTTGGISDKNRVINFKPNPVISEAVCTQATSGQGTQITLEGSGFGQRGKSKVKVGGEEAAIINWNEAQNTITASLDKRIEGKKDIELIRDDGKIARSECTVGTTSVLFSAQSQCRPSGNFAEDNVSVKIFANVPTTLEAEKPDPIIDEKIKLDKDGKPVSFTPRLEKNKPYSLIIKALNTLARRIDFETKTGTKNLDPATLLIGDIAPTQKPDGKVNAFDRSELTRQWSLIRDVVRTGDFNSDARVNSVDYACMRRNINESDESFSPPAPTPSPAFGRPTPTATPSATPVPSVVPTDTPTLSPSPSPTPTPTP